MRGDVCDKEHVAAARRLMSLLAVYQDIEDLVNIGAYVPGANLEFDLAVNCRAKIVTFLKQDPTDPGNLESSRKQVIELNVWVDQVAKALQAQQAQQQKIPGKPARAAG